MNFGKLWICSFLALGSVYELEGGAPATPPPQLQGRAAAQELRPSLIPTAGRPRVATREHGLVLTSLAASTVDSVPPDALITYEGELTEFPRYQESDRLVIEIPEARHSKLVRGDLSACTARGGSTVWSFPNPPGTQAIVRHLPQRIEINFAAEPIALSANASAAVEASERPVRLSLEVPGLPAIATPPEEERIISPPRTELTRGSISDQSIALANFSLDVPDSPAFSVLGLSSETAVRPTSPQELIASTLNGLDNRGHFQTGLALDTAPYLLFFGKDVSLQRYQSSYATRLLTRAQVSFATTKGTESEDRSTRFALGLHLTLLDRGDPRSDLDLQRTYDAIDEEQRQRLGPVPPGPDMQAEGDRRAAEMRPLFKSAFAEARRLNWNRTNWSFGAAPSWIRPSDETSDYRWNGATVWTSFAYGFEGIPALEKSSQLVLHARYRNHEEVPDVEKEGRFLTQDSYLLGARLRVGTVDSNIAADAAYIWESGDHGDQSAYRLALALERRMTQNLWLSLSLGKEFGNEENKDPLLILGGFKVGFGSDPAKASSAVAPPVFFRREAETSAVSSEPGKTVVAPSQGGGTTPVVFLRDNHSGIPQKADRPSGGREATLPPDSAASAVPEKVKPPGRAGRDAALPGTAIPAKAPRPTAAGRDAASPEDPPTPRVPEKAQRPPVAGRDAVQPRQNIPPKAKRPSAANGREATLPATSTPSLVPAKAKRPAAADPRRDAPLPGDGR